MLRTRPLRSLAACLPLLLSSALAAPGDLDFTFGIGGVVTTLVGDNNASGDAVAVQGDGKILVAGYAIVGDTPEWAVVRYGSDGTLDAGFGDGGKVISAFGFSSIARSVAVQSDGKIIVAGNVGSDFGLLRYHPDGSLDTSLGGTGVVLTDFAGEEDIANSMVVQADGKILLAGNARSADSKDMALARYTSAGALDTSFNGTGKVTIPVGSETDDAFDVAVQGDGKILVVGQTRTNNGLASDVALLRFTSTGAPDTSFNGTGRVITNVNGVSGSNFSSGRSVAVQADGKILVLGFSDLQIALVRYTSAGALDLSFNGAGKVVTFTGALGSPIELALQSDGKIVVLGGALARGFKVIALSRFLTDGTLDNGFGDAGRAIPIVAGATFSFGGGVVLQSDGKILASGRASIGNKGRFTLMRVYAGEPVPALPPPVFDTETTSAAGTEFRDFRSPAIDGGQVGGLATVAGDTGRSDVAAYAGADGAVLVANGALDPEGSTFTALGDPVFGGEAVGFAGAAQLAPVAALRDWQMDARLGSERAIAPRVQPGGRLAALYSQISAAAGLRRLAVQTGLAPGTDGQFARFTAFGLPRDRGGLVFAARLHRSGTVNRRNDFGIWRETPAGGFSELLLRIGRRLGGSLAPAGALRARGADDPRTVEKLRLLGPVTNATDQRRSFAPDGGVAAVADFDDDTEGVVFVAADGSIDVPVDSHTPVPDEDGAPVDGIEFTAFSQPATASGGRFALAAALRAAQRGLPPPPSHAVFANRDGTLCRVFSRDGQVPGREGVRFASLGQPLLGERGMIGMLAALTGQHVPPATRKAIMLVDGKVKAVAARLGEQASGFDEGAEYRRFISVVVTDSDPARMVFTGTVSGPGVTAGSSLGLWSVSPSAGVNLLLRTGQPIKIGGATLTVRSFDALKAPKKSMGQGRSTDADGFVTAKATLSDGRKGVLRIPLP